MVLHHGKMVSKFNIPSAEKYGLDSLEPKLRNSLVLIPLDVVSNYYL